MAGLLVAATSWAGTTGKISGRVVDERKQPLIGVNVIVIGAPLGAASDETGRFTIVQIPAGTYTVRASLLGYRSVATQDVVVSADQTTRLDLALAEAPVQMQEIVVSARRPVVEVNRTSNVASVSREEIQALPVQELQEIVNLQAGVVDGHFRGGRLGEVQFQVDGVSVNNAFNNASTLKLDRSLLEEVQVISGTFDAEYGQAMSGVVNAILRRGSDKLQWDAEVSHGSFVWDGGSDRLMPASIRPGAIQGYQASLSGPLPLARTTYLVSGRYAHFDDYVRATSLFAPTDSSGLEADVYRPSGDGREVALGTSREWSGITKLTHRASRDWEFSYQVIANGSQTRRQDWAFRFLPEGMRRQKQFSLVHGLDVSHTFSSTRFANLSVRQNVLHYTDRAYDDLYDARYDEALALRTDDGFGLGAFFLQGVDLGRFTQNSDTWIAKGSFVDQVTRDVQYKFGAEMQWPRIDFGSDALLIPGGTSLTRFLQERPSFEPVQGAGFAQAEVELGDVNVRAGFRLDHFDARSSLPSDLANPANSIAGAPLSVPVPTSRKLNLSPRLGVSYPVTADAAVFFAYGHFYQMPELGQIFANADYAALADIPAGESGLNKGVIANPDIRPERTVQYQFGYKHAVNEWFGVDVSTFYKDIRDLLGVEFVTTYNSAEYARWANVDFGDVVGFTIALDQRSRGLLSSSLDYTWQRAQGNSSDPRETATRAEAGQDPRPRQLPFNWDQRHTLNLTLTLAKPEAYIVSAVLRSGSGQPFTPLSVSDASAGYDITNTSRKPFGAQLDLRAERTRPLFGQRARWFARIYNALDARFFNGFVFNNSGSPYYSSVLGLSERATLENPTRFLAPRRIEIGLSLGGSR